MCFGVFCFYYYVYRCLYCFFFFFKQKTAYERRISDWSSDVCSSDLEIDACREAGVDVSVIPGISAAQGAAASLGFSLTERREARRVQFVTGNGADGKLPANIDWQAVADAETAPGVYLPRKRSVGSRVGDDGGPYG